MEYNLKTLLPLTDYAYILQGGRVVYDGKSNGKTLEKMGKGAVNTCIVLTIVVSGVSYGKRINYMKLSFIQVMRPSWFPSKYYSAEKELVGTWFVSCDDVQYPCLQIKFTPKCTGITESVKAIINLADTYQVPVFMVFNGVKVSVSSETKPTQETIKQIVANYYETYQQLVTTKNKDRVAAY